MIGLLSKFIIKICLILMIIGSKLIFPEASLILQHYCFGDGTKLVLNSDYIEKSPVVQKNLKQMEINQTKIITFNQKEDWRLSYALNGFIMTKKKNKVIIKQYIKFDYSGQIYTYLNFGFFKLKVYDNIVHVFDCKPFEVYTEFSI